MTESPLVLIGGGGHARSCLEVATAAGLPVAGYVAPLPDVASDALGMTWLGADEWLNTIAHQNANFVFLVAVGQMRTAQLREQLFSLLRQLHLPIKTLIAHSAIVSEYAQIGSGCAVMHSAIVNAGVEIGENCIINSQALVEHDCQILSHCHVATGARLNGGVKLGKGVLVGSGAVILPGVEIADGVMVGAGSLVTRAITRPNTIWYGQPARLQG